jgi:hypothetical protein
LPAIPLFSEHRKRKKARVRISRRRAFSNPGFLAYRWPEPSADTLVT